MLFAGSNNARSFTTSVPCHLLHSKRVEMSQPFLVSMAPLGYSPVFDRPSSYWSILDKHNTTETIQFPASLHHSVSRKERPHGAPDSCAADGAVYESRGARGARHEVAAWQEHDAYLRVKAHLTQPLVVQLCALRA